MGKQICVAPAASSQSGFCRPEEVTGLGEGGSCGGRFGYDLKMELTEMWGLRERQEWQEER